MMAYLQESQNGKRALIIETASGRVKEIEAAPIPEVVAAP